VEKIGIVGGTVQRKLRWGAETGMGTKEKIDLGGLDECNSVGEKVWVDGTSSSNSMSDIYEWALLKIRLGWLKGFVVLVTDL
jgi:hypothetical protein